MATETSNAIQSLISSVNGTSNSKASSSKLNDAQNRFLTLLTTQLKNQDPLNPLDNAEVTSQLAQISTVDGIEKLNGTLQQMLSSSLDAETMQAAALVGHSVMVSGTGLQLTQAGAVGGIELASDADEVTVTIKDANGLEIRKLKLGSLDAGVTNFTWDGTSDAGAAAAIGNYRITVEAKSGSEKVTANALQLASVISVNRGSTGISLDLGTLGSAAMNDIKQIF